MGIGCSFCGVDGNGSSLKELMGGQVYECPLLNVVAIIVQIVIWAILIV